MAVYFTPIDGGFGNEAMISALEEREPPYVLKPRHSPKVKALVRELLFQSDGWHDCGESWEATDATLKLGNWSERTAFRCATGGGALALK